MTGDQQPIRVSAGLYTTSRPDVPSTMIPNFEIAGLAERAHRMRRLFPAAGGLALACIGMAVGVAASALTMYAYNQKISDAIAAILWVSTGFLVILAVVFFVVRQQAQSVQVDAFDDYCEEIKNMMRRYGGEEHPLIEEIDRRIRELKRTKGRPTTEGPQ